MFEKFFDRFGERQSKSGSKTSQSKGAGFVIDASGIIVTANYAVKDAIEINVTLADGTKLPATIVGRDDRTGIALIKVSARQPLEPLAFGDSSKVRVGQTVIAIGSPFGLGRSVTSGIISGLHRNINAGPYDNYIQTDAAINKGNSGGPLLDLQGEVIGINTAIVSPTGASVGVGFAVPSDLARGVVDQLKKFGEVRRGWLGVSIQAVTDQIADSLGMSKAAGALVAGVTPGSPAGQGGLKSGDVILKFDGNVVETMRALPRIVAATEVGRTVDVEVLRDGQKRSLKVTIARLPKKPAAPPARVSGRQDAEPQLAETLGLTVEQLTAQTRAKFKIGDNVSGVVITDVRPGSRAARQNLKVGQVILTVLGKSVSSPDDFFIKLNAVKKSGRNNVLLRIMSDGSTRFVALRIS